MSKKKKIEDNPFSIVFSTNPDFEPSSFEEEDEIVLPPNEQRLKIWLDRKQRKGKEVTLITGFEGPEAELKTLGKLLKTKCGVGGTVKEGEIMIQGNHRQKVLDILLKNGYKHSKLA